MARESTRAAKISADAQVATERARFFIIIEEHNLDKFIRAATFYPNSPGMPMSGDIVINYHFKNYGKTPGIVREISHGVALSPHPPDPVYQVIAQAPTENMIAPSGRTDTQTCIKQISVNSIADALLLENGSTHIWFYGRFDYDDVITNEPQVHRFYFRYVRLEAHRFRLQAIDHRHYNEST